MSSANDHDVAVVLLRRNVRACTRNVVLGLPVRALLRRRDNNGLFRAVVANKILCVTHNNDRHRAKINHDLQLLSSCTQEHLHTLASVAKPLERTFPEASEHKGRASDGSESNRRCMVLRRTRWRRYKPMCRMTVALTISIKCAPHAERCVYRINCCGFACGKLEKRVHKLTPPSRPFMRGSSPSMRKWNFRDLGFPLSFPGSRPASPLIFAPSRVAPRHTPAMSALAQSSALSARASFGPQLPARRVAARPVAARPVATQAAAGADEEDSSVQTRRCFLAAAALAVASLPGEGDGRELADHERNAAIGCKLRRYRLE